MTRYERQIDFCIGDKVKIKYNEKILELVDISKSLYDSFLTGTLRIIETKKIYGKNKQRFKTIGYCSKLVNIKEHYLTWTIPNSLLEKFE